MKSSTGRFSISALALFLATSLSIAPSVRADDTADSTAAQITLDLTAPALSSGQIPIQQLVDLALEQNAQDWQINPNEWSISNSIALADGRSIVHLGQEVDGYLVVGNALVLSFSRENALIGSTVINGATDANLEVVSSEATAVAAARTAAALFLTEDESVMELGSPRLAILLPRAASNLASPQLAYQIHAASVVSAKQVEVWIDASNAEVIKTTSLTKFSTQTPSVCNANNSNWSAYRICAISDPQAGTTDRLRQAAIVTDVSNFYDQVMRVTGFTAYNFNAMVGNRQSSSSGNPLSVVINACMSGDTCPMENAFWNSWDRANPYSNGYDPTYSPNDGSDRFFGSMYIGAGLDKSNDVIAHEISHGVSDAVVSTNDPGGRGLEYSGQSGALSEAFSDIFGESVDQLNDSSMAATAYLGKLAYKKDIYALTSAQKTTLRAYATSIRGSSKTVLNVYHYTTTGTFSAKETLLANRRMAAVKAYLVSRGVTTSFTLKKIAIKSKVYKADYMKISKSGTYTLLNVENPTDEQKWLIAEDIPSSIFGGPLRSLADPASSTWLPSGYQQPDSTSSVLYRNTSSCVSSSNNDNCYVHHNSGVPNKAAFLMAMGGSFGGQQVAAMGIWKMNYVIFDVLMNATSTMTFAEFGTQAVNSCQTLAAAGTGGLTAADCTNSVQPALVATGLY